MKLPNRTHDQRDRSSATLDRSGFTLIELLLTVALVLLFAGAVILSFGSLENGAHLEEGAAHVETLFRYTRAQAASTGRQVRIVFGQAASFTSGSVGQTNAAAFPAGTNAGIQVVWEPDPVAAPGRFEALPGSELLVEQVNDLIKVQEVAQPGTGLNRARNGGAPAVSPLSSGSDTNGLALESLTDTTPLLTCYPDGSSDSMDIIFAAANSEDRRLAVVTLWGLSGASRHYVVTPAGLADSALGQDQSEPWLEP